MTVTASSFGHASVLFIVCSGGLGLKLGEERRDLRSTTSRLVLVQISLNQIEFILNK